MFIICVIIILIRTFTVTEMRVPFPVKRTKFEKRVQTLEIQSWALDKRSNTFKIPNLGIINH